MTIKKTLLNITSRLLTIAAGSLPCGNALAQESAQEIRIDPDQPMGSSVSKLFSTVRYIPLETTKESIFGRIDKLYVTDSLFIVLDYATNSIYLFRKNGKFQTSINGGPSPEYGGIRQLSVDRENKIIMFKDGTHMIRAYDFDGNFISDREVPVDFEYFYTLKDSITLYYKLNYDYKKDRQDLTDHELKFCRQGHVFRQAFPYRNYNKTIKNDDLLTSFEGVLFETGNDSSVTFIRTYRPNIYTIYKDTLKESYRFIFPMERSLPADFLDNPAYYGKRIKYVRSTRAKAIFSVSYFYQLKNLAFFRLQAADKPKSRSYSFIYDLSAHTLYAADHIAPDASNYYLPLGALNGFPTSNFVTHGFLCTDGTAVYAAVSSREMFAAKEAGQHKNVIYDDVLKDYFMQSTKKSNPVIVQLLPK